jgi:hypothetical protein
MPKPQKRIGVQKLFDDETSIDTFTVNESYAQHYEQRKKKEELNECK